MMGLKINFHKSCVYKLSRSEEMGTRAAIILNCEFGSLSLTYLGLPIKCPHLLGRIGALLLMELRKSLLLGRVTFFLEDVDLSL